VIEKVIEAKKMSLRPGGVTGISILFLLGAATGIVMGLIILISPLTVITFWNANIGPLLAWIPIIGDNLESIGADTWFLVGLGAVIIGAIDIVVGFGLYKLKKWAYWLSILVSIPLIAVILGIIFIWYLRKDEVKAAFDIM